MSQGATRTVKEMAEAAGVSARTLRYYENIGLLSPMRTAAGYRLYREHDARQLAQVMAMKACGLPLATIKRICAEADADILGTLKGHRAVLQRQQNATADALKRTDTTTYLALVRGYLDDPRFVKYHDSAAGEGTTAFLVQAVEAANA